MIDILSWVAIIALALSYWCQIYKIHVHKEVRDLSLAYYVLLAFGVSILVFAAVKAATLIFFVKQVATLIPICIIIGQIVYHRRSKWHDDEDPICKGCFEELEPGWKCCPYCTEVRYASS